MAMVAATIPTRWPCIADVHSAISIDQHGIILFRNLGSRMQPFRYSMVATMVATIRVIIPRQVAGGVSSIIIVFCI